MPRATHRSLCLCPLGLAPSALLALLLLLALARGEPRASSAGDSDSGSGLGALLRRLMLDLFAWLGSLFGLRGYEVEVHDFPERGVGGGGGGGGDDERRGARFPPRGAGRRSTTASPQEVERFPTDGIDERGLSRGGGGGGDSLDRQPDLHDTDTFANGSPEGGNGDASIEQLGGDGGGGGRGVGDASPEELAGDRPDVPAPARVTA